MKIIKLDHLIQVKKFINKNLYFLSGTYAEKYKGKGNTY